MITFIGYLIVGYLFIGLLILSVTLFGLQSGKIQTLHETEDGDIFDLKDHLNRRWVQLKVIMSWPIAFFGNKN